ncbi:MAG TPA: bifunctional 4-hydroxy-2-oxoglutarate aldolase/2-dehydro-3-deoxy-phosphogluconate aldolase [Woeseiaceae bacterium]|nr:bifunctional 4-hydroxy-2-oxoglutarate aldolase/2-dehydro-3-deoxy-phosphogluconate aldolase [Woeseiaceae bacterium]
MNAADLLAAQRVVPVVVIEEAGDAVPLAKTLLASGLDAIEVTLRTDAGIDAIEQIANEVPGMLVGAGSVRRAAQIAAVKSAGALFAVSPGSSDALLEAVADAELPFVPGAVTASEMLKLLDLGYTLQKFFPAELSGGAAFLNAVAAPIPEVSFMPTGGIGPDNANDYLSLANVACIGGSWIAPPALLRAKNFDAIAELATAAAELKAIYDTGSKQASPRSSAP